MRNSCAVADAVHDLATLFSAQLSHEFKYVVQVQRHQLLVRVWCRHGRVSCLMVWGRPVSPGSRPCPGRRRPNIDLGPLGAIAWVSRLLRCEPRWSPWPAPGRLAASAGVGRGPGVSLVHRQQPRAQAQERRRRDRVTRVRPSTPRRARSAPGRSRCSGRTAPLSHRRTQ